MVIFELTVFLPTQSRLTYRRTNIFLAPYTEKFPIYKEYKLKFPFQLYQIFIKDSTLIKWFLIAQIQSRM